jgi:hypothetical protein
MTGKNAACANLFTTAPKSASEALAHLATKSIPIEVFSNNLLTVSRILRRKLEHKLKMWIASFVYLNWGSTGPSAPQPWPGAFEATYISNITDLSLGGNGSMPVLDPHSAVSATIHYDYSSHKAQLVLHGAGSDECVRFYNTPLPCVTLMNNIGMYRILEGSVPLPCCLDLPAVNCPPPTWASSATEGRDYLGTVGVVIDFSMFVCFVTLCFLKGAGVSFRARVPSLEVANG